METEEVPPRERVLIRRVIGDADLIAEAQITYYRTDNGREELIRTGRAIETLFL